MSDELKTALTAFVQQIIAAAKDGASWTAEQAPMVKTRDDLVKKLLEEGHSRKNSRPSGFDYAGELLLQAAAALAAPPAAPLYEYCPSCRRLGPLFGLAAIRSEETGGRHCVSCFGKAESRLLPLWTAPPAAPPADLVALGDRLRTQDNQMTAHPIFVVEHRDDKRRPWEFVTACLTDDGARSYMKANGHNLRKFSRIFVHSGYRNDEWIGLRNYLLSLPAAPRVPDTHQPRGECPTCGGVWPCGRCTTSAVDLDALKARLKADAAPPQEPPR